MADTTTLEVQATGPADQAKPVTAEHILNTLQKHTQQWNEIIKNRPVNGVGASVIQFKERIDLMLEDTEHFIKDTKALDLAHLNEEQKQSIRDAVQTFIESGNTQINQLRKDSTPLSIQAIQRATDAIALAQKSMAEFVNTKIPYDFQKKAQAAPQTTEEKLSDNIRKVNLIMSHSMSGSNYQSIDQVPRQFHHVVNAMTNEQKSLILNNPLGHIAQLTKRINTQLDELMKDEKKLNGLKAEDLESLQSFHDNAQKAVKAMKNQPLLKELQFIMKHGFDDEQKELAKQRYESIAGPINNLESTAKKMGELLEKRQRLSPDPLQEIGEEQNAEGAAGAEAPSNEDPLAAGGQEGGANEDKGRNRDLGKEPDKQEKAVDPSIEQAQARQKIESQLVSTMSLNEAKAATQDIDPNKLSLDNVNEIAMQKVTEKQLQISRTAQTDMTSHQQTLAKKGVLPPEILNEVAAAGKGLFQANGAHIGDLNTAKHEIPSLELAANVKTQTQSTETSLPNARNLPA